MKNKFTIAISLAVMLAMLVTSLALADVVTSDVDVIDGDQTFINLGNVLPGEVKNTSTSFQLVCAGKNHADQGDKVTIEYHTATVPSDGVLTAGNATIGPILESWPDDTTGGGNTNCPSTPAVMADNGNSAVKITAPTVAGTYDFVVTYKVAAKDGIDTNDVSGSIPAVTFRLTVVANAAPTITVNDVTKEGNTTGGWTLAFADIGSATDAEDGTASVSCTPVIGSVLPLGANFVSCTAADSGGKTAIDSGTVTVVDTTNPTIADNPDMTVEATGPSGAVVTFSNPAASDLVDSSVNVACSPASGSTFALGHTKVTCTATDDSGKSAQSDFDIFVRDTTPPTIDAHTDVGPVEATGPAGAVVTYANPATHDLVSGDGVATCTLVSGGTFPMGETTVTCNATDAAGNPATPTAFKVTVVDTTPPTFNCGSADSIWHADNQSVACSASDSGSGLATPTNFSLSTTVDAGNETANAYTDSQLVCDLASNCVTAGPVGPFKIDRKAPFVSATPDRVPDHDGWYNHALTITFAGVDGGSDSVACAAPVNYSGPNDASVSVPGSCADAVGNSASASFSFKYDGTTPTAALSVTAGTSGANGWYTSDVTVDTSGTGSVSGVTCTADQDQTTETTGQVFNGSCTSGAGLTTNATPLTVKLDKTGPTSVVLTPSGTLGLNGWYNSNVTIVTSGAEDVSTPIICTASQSQTTDITDAIFNGSCTNNAGLSTDAAPLTIKRDATAPVITASISPNRPASGWWNIASGAPVVSFGCSDETSGLAGACPADYTFPDGENQVYSQTIHDNAGNSANAGVNDIDVDLTAPAVTITPERDPDYNGWYNAPVSFSFSAIDDTSEVDNCDSDVNFNGPDSEAAIATGACSDKAGNSGSASVTFKYDNTNPSIFASVTPDVATTGWWNVFTGAPTASFTCGDATAGVKACEGDHTFGSGENQSFTGHVTDNAGNTNFAMLDNIDVDLVLPTISAAMDRSADSVTGWFNASAGAPTVEFTCEDTGSSGLVSCPSDYLFGEGADQSHSGTAYDKAGNNASAGVTNVDVDTIAPSISASVSPARPASGWWNIASGAPKISFTCSDATSGIVGACPSDHTFGEGENQLYSHTIQDNAGNSAAAGATDIDVDLTAPSLTWSGNPANGGSYDFGYVPTEPTCSAADTLSGPNGCTVGGYGNGVGSHTMTATANDKAGNSKVETRAYTVLGWLLKGFYQPVDMNGVYNIVKNGSTVPLKFEIFTQVSGIEITDVGAVDSLLYGLNTCSSTTTTDEIETVATGGTSLRYDTSGGQFIFNWKTPSGGSVVGKCYRVTMKTDDGNSLVAFFKMK